jgi:lipid-A-disaccharide synthase
MVIIYKLSPLTFQLAKRLVKVDNIGLCNIVAGKTVVQELIQDDANPEKISAEIGSCWRTPRTTTISAKNWPMCAPRLAKAGPLPMWPGWSWR